MFIFFNLSNFLLGCNSIAYSPVANMVHLGFLYKGFFLTVSKSFFSADSKSVGSQTQQVERFSKNG